MESEDNNQQSFEGFDANQVNEALKALQSSPLQQKIVLMDMKGLRISPRSFGERKHRADVDLRIRTTPIFIKVSLQFSEPYYLC